MKALAPLAALAFVTFAVAATSVACGGAVEPGGTSSSSGGPSPTSTTTATGTSPTATTTPTAPPTTTTSPGSPSIGTWSGTANGCSNFTIYAADTSAPRYLVVQADKNALGLTGVGQSTVVALGTASSAAQVSIDTYDDESGPVPYCTDVGASPGPVVHRETAIEGTATITVTSPVASDGSYTVTVTLRGVGVESYEYGELETIPDLTYTNVLVGWLPG